ncbi:hypothetical protein BDK51DRAFT_17678 [Blyttiomyces helicus]|uniref:Prefoldin n=1 Tax=Blyttiomyces helicus TaxID=388810 RepID=A0A4P9WCD7_9FUNG|nr:hypothetical protein BDK51DRAFT_17678 [Blyttiomyces helicus]|eukprot:RKO89263.1 hypothetical protein BDK51DRAFT_17678 [Blyttiomyces helicus]
MAQAMNPMNIPLPQLRNFHSQLEEEIDNLANSFAQLKQVQSKYHECQLSLASISEKNKGDYGPVSPVLLILNSPQHLYVPGELSDVEKVLIDVGTGYYIEKVRVVGGWGAWVTGGGP